VLALKQSGGEITGSVGPNADEQALIQKGRIEGNKITMESGMAVPGCLAFGSPRLNLGEEEQL
jgi:hypothetical protein